MQCMFMWDQLNKTQNFLQKPQISQQNKKPRSKMHEMHEEWEKEEEKKKTFANKFELGLGQILEEKRVFSEKRWFGSREKREG